MNAMMNLLRLLNPVNLLSLLSAARLKAGSFVGRLTDYFFKAAQRDIAND